MATSSKAAPKAGSKSPLLTVNDKFGGKDKLVDQLLGILESDESKEDLRKRLLGVSNSKLLHLHEVASAAKTKFGSRDQLVNAAALGREKDKDYVTKLGSFSTPRLLDMAQTAEKRAKRASAKAQPKAKAPKAKPAAKPAGKKSGKSAAASK